MSSKGMPETRSRATSPLHNVPKEAEAASGFILKLYQMVNGAPDEVISWTSSGDAFVIGSDLKRLEAETLPQYFRHNRFQSLVRQLNFYSFRKINRERNVWIYKHTLFHRDCPEDLHLVRRRTCPGPDGRKQRFSRVSARQLGQLDVDASSDDDSIVDSAVILAPVPEKRELEGALEPPSKRVNRVVAATTSLKPDSLETTTYASRDISESDEPEEGPSLIATKKSRSDLAQQSLIVTEVALKLDEFARKAGHFAPRTRRGGSGVVTPPYASSMFSATKCLLTYDDDASVADGLDANSIFASSSGFDSLGALVRSTIGAVKIVSPTKKAEVDGPPVADTVRVQAIAHRILQDCPAFITSATIAGFCMSTSPCGGADLCSKILQLILSCPSLMADFRQYRAALRPFGESGAKTNAARDPHVDTVQQTWDREASRDVAVRDFKVYAVNCIQQILGKDGEAPACQLLSDVEKTLLEHTASVWLKSAGF